MKKKEKKEKSKARGKNKQKIPLINSVMGLGLRELKMRSEKRTGRYLRCTIMLL